MLITSLRASGLLPGLLALSVFSCSGSGEGLDANGRPLTPETAPESTPELTGQAPNTTIGFSSLQASVFTPNCSFSGCHSGAAAPLGLQLDAASAYDNLVNQPSVQQSDYFRVSPGDPDNSYLIQKLEGIAAVGQQMPRNLPPLSIDTINSIRQWIADGASND